MIPVFYQMLLLVALCIRAWRDCNPIQWALFHGGSVPGTSLGIENQRGTNLQFSKGLHPLNPTIGILKPRGHMHLPTAFVRFRMKPGAKNGCLLPRLGSVGARRPSVGCGDMVFDNH